MRSLGITADELDIRPAARQMLADWPYEVVTQLRDSQSYVVMVGLGRSLFDYHSAQVREHQQDWEPLLKWLNKV